LQILFNERFGLNLTVGQILGQKSYHKLYGRPRHHYTPDEIGFLEQNIAGHSYEELTKLFNERFGTNISHCKITGVLKYHGFRNGDNGCFKKRKPYPQRHGFKKGHSINSEAIGTEKIDCQGYVRVKVRNGADNSRHNWKRKHLIIWEAENGPIPEGHRVIFADGNKLNSALDNLLLVSLGELGVMNRYGLISPDRELTKTGKALADMKLLICRREREAKQSGGAAAKQRSGHAV
jgi:hypothetical protein